MKLPSGWTNCTWRVLLFRQKVDGIQTQEYHQMYDHPRYKIPSGLLAEITLGNIFFRIYTKRRWRGPALKGDSFHEGLCSTNCRTINKYIIRAKKSSNRSKRIGLSSIWKCDSRVICFISWRSWTIIFLRVSDAKIFSFPEIILLIFKWNNLCQVNWIDTNFLL